MDRVSPLATLIGVLTLYVAAGCPEAYAQDWQQLPEKTQLAIIAGQPVSIVIRPEVKFSDSDGGGIHMSARAHALLDDLQAKGPGILRSIAVEQSNCGLRLSIPNVSPVAVQGTRLKIGGRAHAEQWLCAGPLKTRLVEADADFVIGLWPVANERAVTVSAELEMFDVDGIWSSISDELRKALSSSLSRMAEGMKFNFPPEIANLNPRFTDAQLADLGNGRGELDIEASVIIRAADMARLIALMTK